SGLGLLLTTSFLGLRLYLRGRGLRMPAAITGAWLCLGGLLTVVLLVGSALLPRPQSEVNVFSGDRAGSPERRASKANLKEGQPGEGEGDPDKGRPGKDNPEKGADRAPEPGKEKQKDKGGKEGKDRNDG